LRKVPGTNCPRDALLPGGPPDAKQVNDGPLLAKLAKGSDNTWAYTGGLNWYLNKNFKMQFNYERANFAQHVAFGATSRKHEDVLLTRFQLQF